MNVRKEHTPLLQAKDLSLFYQDSLKPILDEITLDVYAGELVLIAGPSGSGKFSLIAGDSASPVGITINREGNEFEKYTPGH